MNVPYLTVYFDSDLGCVADEGSPDTGTDGVRFTSPKSAGEWVAFRLVQWQAENDAKEAEAEKQARSAISRTKLKAYGDH